MTPASDTSNLNSPSSRDGNEQATQSSMETAAARITAEARSIMQRPPAAFRSREMQDVTENFIAAAKRLQPGELVKDEYFTLFEAVGALEIMDPKMDSGYVEPGDAFEPDYQVDVDEPSSAEARKPIEWSDHEQANFGKALWIMDEIMRLEMLFHEGYPLSQNIFTSLHIFRLIDPSNTYPYRLISSMKTPSVTQKVIRAFCLAVIKSCQLVLDCIQAQTFYEEEDFVTHLFGRELCPDISAQEIAELVSQSIGELHNDRSLEKSNVNGELTNALVQRLDVRHSLLVAFQPSNDPRQALSDWRTLRGKLAQSSSTHALAEPSVSAFSDKVQRQLASSTPPRPMPQISWQEAQHKWVQLCDDIIAAHEVTSIEVVQSPHQLKSAVWSFSYRNPAPMAYARAKLQELLTLDDKIAGDVSHFDLMLADIRELVLPHDPMAEPESFLVEATHDIRHRTSRIIEDFMVKSFGEYLNIYRMMCQNRDRTRRLFTQALPIFDELEALASEADEQVFSITSLRFTTESRTDIYYPLWTWTRLHKLYLVQWTVQLGFETGLHQGSGVCEMYDVLASVLGQIERTIDTIISSALTQARTTLRGRHLLHEEFSDSITWLSSFQKECNVNQNLAVVLTLLWDFLNKLEVFPRAHSRPYYQIKKQYEARMKPFLRMQHPVVPSLENLQSREAEREANLYSAVELQGHLERIMGFSKASRQQQPSILEQLKSLKAALQKEDVLKQQEYKRIEATCWAIKITIGQLVDICKSRGREQIKSDQYSLQGVITVYVPGIADRKHPWWVVPKIAEVAI